MSGATRLGGGQRRMHMGGDDLFHRAFKRHMAGQGVIEGAAQAVHVGMKILAFAFELFRGDVIDRAPDVLFPGVVLRRADQAEINQLGFAVHVEKDIARLDVAMEQFVLKGGGEGGADFDADIQHIQFRHPALGFDAAVQAALVGQFHDQVGLAVEFVEAVNMNDVGVVEGGAGAGFAIKGLQDGRRRPPFRASSFSGRPGAANSRPAPYRPCPCRRRR